MRQIRSGDSPLKLSRLLLSCGVFPVSTATPSRTDVPVDRHHVPQTASLIGLVASVAVAVLANAALIGSMFTGYDVTDEGFYLYAADPSNRTNVANGLWGMYLGLLYEAVGYSLVGFRIAGAVLLATCAGWLGWQTGALLGMLAGRPLNRIGRIALVVSTVTAAQLYYAMMVLTPSYNWLALCGLMLALAGLIGVLTPSGRPAADFGNMSLISFGSFLCLWGRMVAGAAVLVIAHVLVLSLAAGGRRHRVKLIAAGTGAMVVLGAAHSIVMLDPATTLDVIQRAGLFNFAHGFSELPSMMMDDVLSQVRLAPRTIHATAWWWPLLGFAAALAVFAPSARRSAIAAAAACAAVLTVGAALVIAGRFGGGAPSYTHLTPAVLALLLTAALGWAGCALARRTCGDREGGLPRRAALLIGVLVAVLVSAQALYAFTSNNPLLGQMSSAAVLSILGSQLLLAAAAGRRMVSAVLTLALLMPSALAACVVTGRQRPYRDAPLAMATVPVTINRHGAQILLAPDYAAYYNDLAGRATAAGFTPGTPLIDLTPFSPGVPERLGALAPDTLLMGYTAGTAQWVAARQDHAVWRNAWLLVRRTDQGSMDVNSVTAALGRLYPADYEMIASATYPYHGNEHQLWRPRPG